MNHDPKRRKTRLEKIQERARAKVQLAHTTPHDNSAQPPIDLSLFPPEMRQVLESGAGGELQFMLNPFFIKSSLPDQKLTQLYVNVCMHIHKALRVKQLYMMLDIFGPGGRPAGCVHNIWYKCTFPEPPRMTEADYQVPFIDRIRAIVRKGTPGDTFTPVFQEIIPELVETMSKEMKIHDWNFGAAGTLLTGSSFICGINMTPEEKPRELASLTMMLTQHQTQSDKQDLINRLFSTDN